MNPQDRLDSAEEFYNTNGQTEEQDFYWLVARIRQLEADIEKTFYILGVIETMCNIEKNRLVRCIRVGPEEEKEK